MTRECIRCGAPITACMGSVLARDLLAFHEGRIEAKQIREHCGRCTVALIAYEYGGRGSFQEQQSYLNSIPDLRG